LGVCNGFCVASFFVVASREASASLDFAMAFSNTLLESVGSMGLSTTAFRDMKPSPSISERSSYASL
jgi:hypothetical protein